MADLTLLQCCCNGGPDPVALLQGTQQNAALVQAAATRSLRDQAGELAQRVSIFKIDAASNCVIKRRLALA